MARQVENARLQTGGALSCAAMAARGAPLAGAANVQAPRIPSMQTQREAVMAIRTPSAVLSPLS